MALVVPTTLLAALAVLTLAGGFAGLGALGQAFSGPSLEAAKGPAAPGAPPRRAISSAVLAALTSPAPPASTASVARAEKAAVARAGGRDRRRPSLGAAGSGRAGGRPTAARCTATDADSRRHTDRRSGRSGCVGDEPAAGTGRGGEHRRASVGGRGRRPDPSRPGAGTAAAPVRRLLAVVGVAAAASIALVACGGQRRSP